MTVWKRLFAYFSSFFSKILQQGTYIRRTYFHFGTGNDFILRIAPLRDKDHDSYRNYFPPPCYGFPYGKTSYTLEDPPENYQKYGLFLWPDRLYQNAFHFFLLLIATVVPFTSLLCCRSNCEQNTQFYWAITILIFIAALVKIIFIFIATKKNLPVLHQIWALWPESHYSRFLTVPHLSHIARQDKNRNINKYWNPDINSPLISPAILLCKRKKYATGSYITLSYI